MRNYDFAKIAYDAYTRQTDGISLVSGEKLPDFWSLSQPIQDAWWAAADAIWQKSQLREAYRAGSHDAEAVEALAKLDEAGRKS